MSGTLTKEQKKIIKKYSKYANSHRGNGDGTGAFVHGGVWSVSTSIWGLGLLADLTLMGGLVTAMSALTATLWFSAGAGKRAEMKNYEWNRNGQKLKSHVGIAASVHMVESRLQTIFNARSHMQQMNSKTATDYFWGPEKREVNEAELKRLEDELRAEEAALIPAIEVLGNKPYQKWQSPRLRQKKPVAFDL